MKLRSLDFHSFEYGSQVPKKVRIAIAISPGARLILDDYATFACPTDRTAWLPPRRDRYHHT
jgi:hypothetical protein